MTLSQKLSQLCLFNGLVEDPLAGRIVVASISSPDLSIPSTKREAREPSEHVLARPSWVLGVRQRGLQIPGLNPVYSAAVHAVAFRFGSCGVTSSELTVAPAPAMHARIVWLARVTVFCRRFSGDSGSIAGCTSGGSHRTGRSNGGCY